MASVQEHDVLSSREVEELLQPQRKLLARLRRAEVVSKGDLDEAIGQVTALAAAVLRVERASVWRLAGEETRIECVDLFVRSAGLHQSGSELTVADFPRYFEALLAERIIAAGDACKDPRTAEFETPYLVPNGIGAMLDAPIFHRGKMVGVICHEHVGGPRLWNLWEELIAGTLADFVAHVLEVEERAKELRESEENFRRLFEAAPSPLVLARVADGTVGLLNSRARALMVVPEAVGPYEIAAERFYENPSDRTDLLSELREKGIVTNRELPMRTFEGEVRQCLVSAQPLIFRGEPHIAVGISDITRLKRIEEQLRDAAMRDALTGVFNRRHFYDTCALEMERARRYDRSLSLAMIDVDKFKEKNDRYGHVVGDELLVALAKIAGGSLRKTDIFARYGGEEFVLLYTETDLDEAVRVTDRVRAALATTPVPTSAGPVTMSISGGVAKWTPDDATIESLIERADRALYRAKELGRDRVERAVE